MKSFVTLLAYTQKLSLLFVEDYKPFIEEFDAVLQELFGGYSVANSGAEALELYVQHQENHGTYFDIVITDIRMPGMGGVLLSKEIRKKNSAQEIIVLSAYTESADLVSLINIGIRRFITKPIVYEEFFQAVLEAAKACAEKKKPLLQEIKKVAFGEGLLWDSDKKELSKDGNSIYCTAHEIILLDYLMENQGILCTPDHIANVFFSRNIEIDKKGIRNLVLKLRKKIGSSHISNVYGLGYRLQAN